jgi:hypothetical protein
LERGRNHKTKARTCAEPLDTRTACVKLDKPGQAHLKRWKGVAARALGKEAAGARTAFVEEKTGEAVARGLDVAAARLMAEQWGDSVLRPGVILEFDDLGAIDVAAILADPARIEGETFADPIEGVASYNEFSAQTEVAGLAGYEPPELHDHGATRLRFLIHESFSFLPLKELFEDVLIDIAHLNRFHPVRDWLGSLVWDGVPRIDNWLIAYGGAENTAFNRAIGRIFLVADVRRVRQPGCKFDTLLVLESPAQGKNKSQAAEILAMKKHWFTDGLSLDADPKVVI